MSGAPGGHSLPGNRWDLLDGSWPSQPPSVSVIVAHHDQPRQLRRLAAALAAQTHPAEHTEVIVVDDGSPEPPSVPAGWTLLHQEHRGTPGAARNRGAALARGEVLCFLDADTYPEPGYLRALTRLPALAPEAVTVGRRRHADFEGCPLDTPPGAGAGRQLPEPQWLRAGYAETRDLLNADERTYRYVISAVLACTRWFFADTGGFADFAEYGGEDWDWAHRAWRNGAILAHVCGAVAWHDGPDWSGRDDDRRRREVKNRETLRLAARIGVPGSRGRAVLPRDPEIVIRLTTPAPPAASFVCVDSLLEAFPEALVVLPGPELDAFAGDPRIATAVPERRAGAAPARLELEVHRAVRAEPATLREACLALLGDEDERLILTGGDGPLIEATGARATARRRHWGPPAGPPRSRRAPWLAELGDDPDLEAYLGGWGPAPGTAG